MTVGPSIGSLRRWRRLDLYEQCSLHCASNAYSSVSVGSRPKCATIARSSSGESATPVGFAHVPVRSSVADLLRRRDVQLGVGLQHGGARVGLDQQHAPEDDRIFEREALWRTASATSRRRRSAGARTTGVAEAYSTIPASAPSPGPVVTKSKRAKVASSWLTSCNT